MTSEHISSTSQLKYQPSLMSEDTVSVSALIDVSEGIESNISALIDVNLHSANSSICSYYGYEHSSSL